MRPEGSRPAAPGDAGRGTASAGASAAAARMRWFYSYDWAVALYLVTGIALARVFQFQIPLGAFFNLQYDLFMLAMVAISLAGLALATAVAKRVRGEDDRLFGSAWRRSMRGEYLTGQHLYDLARVLLALKVVLLVHCSLKQAIPRMNQHVTDEALLRLDVLLHLGTNPMRALVAALGHPTVSALIDQLYVLWYAVKAPTLVLFIVLPDRRLSERFFGAYFLLWMVGGLFAVLLPSLGPIYLHHEWFDGLNKPFATQLQNQLLWHYLQAVDSPEKYRVLTYEGIAAFPSLHVGIVVLFALFLWRVRRWLGVLMGLYAVAVQVGSVFLGWHYAVDGYFAAVLAWLLYRLFTRGDGRAGRAGPPEPPAYS